MPSNLPAATRRCDAQQVDEWSARTRALQTRKSLDVIRNEKIFLVISGGKEMIAGAYLHGYSESDCIQGALMQLALPCNRQWSYSRLSVAATTIKKR